jgi:hypothetical protein
MILKDLLALFLTFAIVGMMGALREDFAPQFVILRITFLTDFRHFHLRFLAVNTKGIISKNVPLSREKTFGGSI